MDNKTLRAGYGKADITPEESVPLAGFGNTSMRMSRTVRDGLRAGCIALSDDTDSTVLLFDVDLILVDDTVLEVIRQRIEKELGIDQDRVILCCTHSHSSPDIWNTDETYILRYHELLGERFTDAARQALEDRTPADMYAGSVEVFNMNFVRHYRNTTPEGEIKYFGDNFGTPVYDETTTHATEADTSLHLLQFKREGKKDIVAVNWRAHPHFVGVKERYAVSADYPGAFRRCMEQMRGCHAVFFQGCGGNMNPITRLAHERRVTTCDSYGMALAAAAVEGLEKHMTLVPGGAVTTKRVMLTGQMNHTTDHLIPVAQKVRQIWTATNDTEKTMEVARPYGIRSPYHANAILSRKDRPLTHDIELNAIAIGPDVAFVTGGEMFDTLSVMTETDSPYPYTLMLGYSCDYCGYIPSKFGYDYTCYESDCSWFIPGTGEEIVKCYLQMLKELKG